MEQSAGAGIRREVARLVSSQRWLALGVIDERGDPAVSYVPFVAAGGAFSIVVSRLAAHTESLLAGRAASVMLVDDDPALTDSYARKRLSIAVAARRYAAGTAEANAIWSALEGRHGQTVAVLRMLPDFEALALEPRAGRLVLGFASAHDLDAEALSAILR